MLCILREKMWRRMIFINNLNVCMNFIKAKWEIGTLTPKVLF